ncbi:MAG: hypothetical protein WAW79_13350 [Steroidobacteraceae bacterium]
MRGPAALSLALLAAPCLAEGQLELSVDLRLIAADARPSYLDSGLGKLRFDEDHDGLQIGRLRAAWSRPFGERLNLHIDASLWRLDDYNALDLTEAYLEYRPYPSDGWRSRIKFGAFYAPISLEHRAAGWTNPYLISSSAINTWIGDELRTIGAEYSLDWLGTRSGHDFDLGLVAAVYLYNDPAGILVASRGWALHDRQTTLFGRVGESGDGFVAGRVLFEEIDDRPGYYVGVNLRYLDRVDFRLMHYDNRADPARFDPGINDFAWLTSFDSIGVRAETAGGWTFIGQWLGGETIIEPDSGYEVWEFSSVFAMLSRAIGKHRISARADWFDTDHVRTSWPPALEETGTALTAGYSYDRDEHWNFAVEAMQVESDFSGRSFIGEPTRAVERILQLQLRYSLLR